MLNPGPKDSRNDGHSNGIMCYESQVFRLDIYFYAQIIKSMNLLFNLILFKQNLHQIGHSEQKYGASVEDVFPDMSGLKPSSSKGYHS